MSVWAVVVAGGRGARAGLGRNKVFFAWKGRSVLSRCLDALERSGTLDGAVLVLGAEDFEQYDALCAREGASPLVKRVVAGGDCRRRSVRSGLAALPEEDREIFYRFYDLSQTTAQIADALHLNASTVRSRLMRGRETLRKLLSKGGLFHEDDVG